MMINIKYKGISYKLPGIARMLAVGFLLFISSLSFAQRFTATCDVKEIPQNYTFDVTYTAENGDLEKFSPPKFEGFDAYGPSQSQNISIINGRMSKSVSYTYTLQPKKQGDFTIPPATAVINGKSMQSNSLSIKVSAPQKQSNQNQNAQGGGGFPFPDPYSQQTRPRNRTNNESEIKAEIAKNLFVVVTPNKNSIYEGDQITLSYKLYFRIQYQGLNVIKAPSYNGFLSEEFKIDQEKEPAIEVYNGKKYYAQEFKRIALFPQKSGKFSVEPMQFAGTVFIQVPDPFFNDPFFSTLEPYNYSFQSNPIELEVRSLPKPQPANFSGAVGNFSFAANYDKTKVKVSEPISLKVSYTGTGNLKLIQAPKLQFPDEFEVYEPKLKEDYATQGSLVSGSKSFEYILVPQDGGKFTLPAYEFGYFDPQKEKYVTFKLPETIIEVEGQAAPTANLLRILKRDKLEGKKQDIYDILTQQKPAGVFFGTPLFWGLTASPLLLLFVGFFLRKRDYNESEILLLRRKKATRMAMKRLATAKKLMQPKHEKAFYDEVIRALWQYVSDKLYIKTSDLSKDNMGQKLLEKNVTEEKVTDLKIMLDTCEQALFSQEGKADTMQETYTNAVKWITEIDEQLTKEST